MAAHTGHSTRSRRFIKIYLGTWGLLAVMALGYLAMLAFPRQSDAPPQAAVETAGGAMADAGSGGPGSGDPGSEPRSEPQSATETASRSPADADGGSDIRKDGAPPPDGMGERVAQGETPQVRVSALEERARGTVGPVARPSAVPGITIAEGGGGMNGAGTPVLSAEAPSGSAPGAAADTPGEAPPSPASATPPAPAPFVPIETGSIAPPPPPVTPEPGVMKPRIVKVAPVRVAPTERAPETVSVAPEPAPKVEPVPEAKDGTEVDTADIAPDADRKVAAETAATPAKVAPESKSEPETKAQSKSETRMASLAPETATVASKEEIVFGAPLVRRGSHEFAVQLGASPSVEALRRSWDKMAERYAAALGGLQPRVIEPGPDSGVYRLLAGPVPTKAQAERICAELGVGPNGCFATNYAGAPL